ncbi:MAG: putative oxidoreductase [Myxococcales bacterium]|nr:putative oxidoreductase [Myxococcales bacterium]
MERQRLGLTPVSVSRVIHGCMGFSEDAARSTRAIHAAFAAGVTSFDTAPLYGFGRSEEVLGAALADRRGQAQILTKVGLRWDAAFGRVLFEITDAGGRRVVRKDSRPSSLRGEVEASLRRLKVDALDLLQVHHRDTETPLPETMAALAQLVEDGKVRAIGISNFSLGDTQDAAHGLGALPLASTQLEYNLIERRIEKDLLPWARSHSVSVLAYSPFAQGVLAGRQRGAAALPSDWRRGSVAFSPENLRIINQALERGALPIAEARGASLAEVSLAWLLAQPGLTAVVVGASTEEQATANARASDLHLTEEELRQLASAWNGLELVRPRSSATPVERTVRKVRSLLSRLIR